MAIAIALFFGAMPQRAGIIGQGPFSSYEGAARVLLSIESDTYMLFAGWLGSLTEN